LPYRKPSRGPYKFVQDLRTVGIDTVVHTAEFDSDVSFWLQKMVRLAAAQAAEGLRKTTMLVIRDGMLRHWSVAAGFI
jgi:hypothetical protein